MTGFERNRLDNVSREFPPWDIEQRRSAAIVAALSLWLAPFSDAM
jgi:hypothetical protein